jgi:hypothetical protein
MVHEDRRQRGRRCGAKREPGATRPRLSCTTLRSELVPSWLVPNGRRCFVSTALERLYRRPCGLSDADLVEHRLRIVGRCDDRDATFPSRDLVVTDCERSILKGDAEVVIVREEVAANLRRINPVNADLVIVERVLRDYGPLSTNYARLLKLIEEIGATTEVGTPTSISADGVARYRSCRPGHKFDAARRRSSRLSRTRYSIICDRGCPAYDDDCGSLIVTNGRVADVDRSILGKDGIAAAGAD